MIKHVVLYKFSDTISADVINDIIKKFNCCKEKLDGIIEINFGYNWQMDIQLKMFSSVNILRETYNYTSSNRNSFLNDDC